MNKFFAWAKEHPAATAAIVLIGGVVFYLIFRGSGSSSGSGVAQLAQTQAAATSQANQLNAQLQAQTEQTQAQLAAQQLQVQAQAQAQQDTIAGQVIGEQLSLQPQLQGQQLQAELLNEQLANQYALASSLGPLAQQQIGKGGSLETAGLNELGLLLGQGAVGGLNNLPGGTGHTSTGFTLNIPNVGGFGVSGL